MIAETSPIKRPILHFLAGAHPRDLLRTLIDHGGFSPRYSGQIALMLLSGAVQLPAFFIEANRARRAKNYSFDLPPVIIVGHWRSGTTYLHNLMSRDPAFCFPTITSVLRPYDFFPGPLQLIPRAIMMWSLPRVRPMDGVPLTEDLPQEDEIALASMGAPSFFNALYFPTRTGQIFDEEVFLQGPDPAIEAAWARRLHYFLAKISLLAPGRRLLLKNPAHSARVEKIRSIFPGTKFIHIHRDPIEVIASTRKLYRHLLALLALQDFDLEAIGEHIVHSYIRLMTALSTDLTKLPASDIAEVCYADLVKRPVEIVREIYPKLGLAGFDAAEPLISQFARQPYRNRPPESSDWQFAIRNEDRVAGFRRQLGYE